MRLLLILCVFPSLSSYAFTLESPHCYISDFSKLDDTLKFCSTGFDHSTGIRVKRSIRTIRSVVITASDTILLPTLVKQTPIVARLHIHSNASTIDYTRLCDWKYLLEMHLSGNPLSNLPSHSLRMCHKLSSLTLKGKINDIAKDTFDGMTELVWLDLSYNEIKHLHKDTFKPLPKLKYLYLDSNRLQIIHSDLFLHNPELKRLYLISNELRTVGHGAFRMMSASSRLWIRGNRHLESIDLTKNSNGDSIGLDVHIGDCALKTLSIPMGVKSIRAERNQITTINAHPNNRLIKLQVQNNNLSSVANITLPFVNSIDVMGNNFMSFSEFYGFKQLTNLLFDLNPKQKFSIDEIRQNLPLLESVSFSSPGMSAEKQKQIINNFKRYNIYCNFFSQ